MKRDIIWAIVLIFLVAIALRIDTPYKVRARSENGCQGKVRIPDCIDELALVRRGITTVIPPGKKEVMLPVGEYEFLYWKINRTDKSNVKWQLSATRFPRSATVKIAARKTAKPEIGEPVTADLHIGSYARGTYTIGQTMKGKLGEHVEVYRKGKHAEPSVRITNPNSTYTETFKFKYG